MNAFLVLHEFGHQMDVHGPDEDPAVNGANSAMVLNSCFSVDGNGVYH